MKSGIVWDTEIIVARHGETDWNRVGKWQGSSDIPLNPLGHDQASALANLLKGENIRYIYSSDLSRAKSTAEIVRKTIGAYPVVEDKRLRERNLGKFEGWDIYHVAKYMGVPEDEAQNLEVDELMIDNMPSVEKWARFTERVWDALNDIREKHMGSKCLVVAHGGVMRAITMKLSDSDETKLNFGNTEILRLMNSTEQWMVGE